MEGQATTNRLPYLDYARVFAAYLVILGHLLSSNGSEIRSYIYSFHMPFFFLVSGMLHKDLGYIAWKKYWKTLVVPFLFFNLLFFILWPICWKVHLWGGGPSNLFDENVSVGSLYYNYFVKTIIDIFKGKGGPDGPTWFLLALLWCKLANDVLCRRKLMPYAGIALLAAVLGITFWPKAFLQIGNALMVMPFFYLGFRYKREIRQWCEKETLFVGIFLLLLCIPSTLLNGRVSTYGMTYGQLTFPLNVLVYYINAFAVSLGLLVICTRFRQARIITVSAKALISILCVHGAFIYILRIYGHPNNILFCAFISCVIMVFCVLCHQLMERYLPFAVGKSCIRSVKDQALHNDV